MTEPVTIHQHTLLEERGGATAVAKLLAKGLSARSVDNVLSYELAESEQNPRQILPREMTSDKISARIIHVHASMNWPKLLKQLALLDKKAVLTVHDCRLITGGCPYPLDCQLWTRGCPGSCPRGFHESSGTLSRKQELLTRLDPVLVVPSKWMRSMVVTLLPDMKIRVIPNGIEWPETLEKKEQARRHFGFHPESRVVLFTAHGGSRAQYKGGDRWMWIWEGIKSRVDNALGVFVGGDEVSREGDLLCLPYLPASELTRIMRASDLMIYPTLADNHPLVILEAMARGTCILSFATGGIPEQILDGHNGFLSPAGDWDGMVDKAVSLLKSPSTLRRTGFEAYASGASRFKLSRMTSDYLKLYSTLF